MKAKLIKEGDKYYIRTEDKFNGIDLACYPHDITKQKLSLKNCQAIENGYDLDKLSNKFMKSGKTIGGGDSGWIEDAFKEGFKKCLEILGDRKYTEKDMYIFGKYVWKYSANTHPIFDNPKGDEGVDEILELKTEWDVKINTVNSRTGKSSDGSDLEWDEDGMCDELVPVFDEDGCLQLTPINL